MTQSALLVPSMLAAMTIGKRCTGSGRFGCSQHFRFRPLLVLAERPA